MKKNLSIDAETNGLWGKAFAIAAVLQQEDGSVIEFIGRCPIEGETNEWVRTNVLPEMEDIKITHENYEHLLGDFIAFYMLCKKDTNIIVHMGLPVEVRLFLDAHNMGILGDWDAPYPLIDICTFPEIGTSVDGYNQRNNIIVPFNGSTHNPLYDSYAALVAYNNIIVK